MQHFDRRRIHARYGPWALIAGASEGIGRAFAEQLAACGLNLVLTARREAPLTRLSGELEQAHHIVALPVSADLARPDIDQVLRNAVGDRAIGLIVYNACYSVIGPYLETATRDKELMIDVNCRGPVRLIDAFVPEMVERGRGGVILMSSMSGFQGSALVATYAATKAFNTILAEGLWEELAPHGIDVLGMVAGATRTPGFEQQTPPSRQRMTFPMNPDDVAREALAALGRRPLAIAGPVNRAVHFVFSRLVPRQTAVRFFARTTRKVYGS